MRVNKKSTVPEYLNRFSPAQRRVIIEERPVKQVIAAAGSGKTSTVIGLVEHRLQSELEEPGRILLLSFSRRAVTELRERLKPQFRQALEISTFHSFCYRQLSRLHPDFVARPPQIIEEEEKLDFYRRSFRRHHDEIGGIPFSLLLRRSDLFEHHFPELKARIDGSFADFKRESGRLEYEDLIELLLHELQRGSEYLRPLRRRYGLIIVDEFQDTDPRQLEFLKEMSPPRILTVGDDWQAIYSFRGATVEPFLKFNRVFKNTKRYHLAENYRSSTPIIQLGNRVIRASSRQLRKNVKPARVGRPRFPVYSLQLNRNQGDLLAKAINDYQPDELKILVRSNYRRRYWEEQGVSPEQVMTIHKAKGLEFPVVLLDLVAGWSGGDEKSDRINDEEVRVAYVGLTRAQNLLLVLNRYNYNDGDTEKKIYACFGDRLRELELNRLSDVLERERLFRGGDAA